MNNLLRAELYKLKRNKMFWTLMILMTLWGILQAVVISLAAHDVIYYNNTHGFYFGTSGSGPKYSASGVETFLITLGSVSNPFFLSLLIGIFAGFFISNEYTTGVAKNVIVFGKRRGEIFLAKFIVFFLGVAAVWLIFPLIAAGGATASIGLGELDNTMIGHIIRVIGLSFILLAAYTALLTFIGIMVEESGKTIILSVTIISGLTLGFLLLGSSVSAVRSVYEYTIFHQMFAAFSPTLTSMEWLRCFLVGLITMLLFIASGIQFFGRKELK